MTGAIFKTGLKYLRPSPPSLGLRVMTTVKTKPFVNCYKTKTNVRSFVQTYDKSLSFKTKIKPFVITSML